MKNSPFAICFHLLVVVFMMAPLVVVCLVAFTPANTLSIPWGEWSLRWFRAVFEHSDLVSSFRNSLVVACVAATASVIFAVPAALAIARFQFSGRQALSALLMSPLIVPHLVLGVAMLRLFALLDVRGSSVWLTVAHVVVIMPYALRLMLAAMAGCDPSIEQAARSMGATRWIVFWRVTLPMMLPGVTGGWVLGFINSFDEVTMSIFITSPQTVTLPVRMYVLATESIDPTMAAVSALIIALTAVVMFVLDRLYGLDRVLVGQQQ